MINFKNKVIKLDINQPASSDKSICLQALNR